MSYPNQKHITVKKCHRDNGKTFVYMSTEALQDAMNKLTPSGLKMWLYLAKNQTKYEIDLSSKACKQWGITGKSSYDRAVTELMNAGYLHFINGNEFVFVESPKLDTELQFVEVEEFPQRKQQTQQKGDSVIPNLPGLKDGVSFQLKNV